MSIDIVFICDGCKAEQRAAYYDGFASAHEHIPSCWYTICESAMGLHGERFIRSKHYCWKCFKLSFSIPVKEAP